MYSSEHNKMNILGDYIMLIKNMVGALSSFNKIKHSGKTLLQLKQLLAINRNLIEEQIYSQGCSANCV